MHPFFCALILCFLSCFRVFFVCDVAGQGAKQRTVSMVAGRLVMSDDEGIVAM